MGVSAGRRGRKGMEEVQISKGRDWKSGAEDGDDRDEGGGGE